MSPAIKQALSPQAIIVATGLACLFYALMLILSLTGGSKVLEGLEARMAAQNIIFERPVLHKTTALHHGDKASPSPNAEHHEDLSAQITGSKEALPPAPFHGLTEETIFGFLPVIGDNKLKPFDAYKKPVTLDKDKPVIALGITGIGLSGHLYNGIFTRLTPQVSLILSPYVPGIDTLQQKARGNGYEVWLSLPLENKNFPNADPGSKGILVNAGLKFNQENYKSILASTSGYVGIAAHTDSAFADAKPMLTGILGEAFSRGLGFFEMNSGRDAMSLTTAINARAPYVANSLRSPEQTVEKRFIAFKRLAKRNKEVVGVLEISPAMLAGFQKEVLKAQEEGFQIVPLSAVAGRF